MSGAGVSAAPLGVVLTDIEGTTSAIAFVKETLFPFAERALDGFLDAHGDIALLGTAVEFLCDGVVRPSTYAPVTNPALIAWLTRHDCPAATVTAWPVLMATQACGERVCSSRSWALRTDFWNAALAVFDASVICWLAPTVALA